MIDTGSWPTIDPLHGPLLLTPPLRIFVATLLRFAIFQDKLSCFFCLSVQMHVWTNISRYWLSWQILFALRHQPQISISWSGESIHGILIQIWELFLFYLFRIRNVTESAIHGHLLDGNKNYAYKKLIEDKLIMIL